MSTVAVTRIIEAHAVDVWRLLTDLPGRAARLSATGPIEVLTPGPFGPGTAWREERAQPDGGALSEEFLVVEALAPQRLVLVSSGAGVDYRITWTLRPVRRRRRGCTAITVAQEAVPTDPYGRVVALLLGGLAARAVEVALRRDLADLAAAASVGTSLEAA
ncbi:MULTISPECIES: SRPBCC family protein [unclassified Micromonospora]|uniref:SRPBCC family protein n=1 Tax=unclassified Micromonospora TaxID=2617518 RepID=UPI00249A463E|nr:MULTISPECIES: SRPBCC family protein [unclassified Micromonospora]WFE51428.1 SRPBCC family protein [Micromonospora sp. WMMD1155]WFF01845.1 SRPBCC family protein [Micromonospora sp. WMMD964]